MVDLVRRQPARYGGRADTALAVVLDCADLARAADFWCAALGYVALPKEVGSGPYHVLLPADGDGIELLLQQVPDTKVGKNRMHFDLRVLDLDAEVAHLARTPCEPGDKQTTHQQRVGVARASRP
jgi:catechol 2,3-dioxygenase-like lactoylglutathione lyase family enzyme